MSLLTHVALSNLYTMQSAMPYQPLQEIPNKQRLPDEDVRYLRANLIMEEAKETIEALGFRVSAEIEPSPQEKPDLDKIIDGACDSIYVNTGLLMSCGVADGPHLEAVCQANNLKFPSGVKPTFNEHGKFLKPKGWTPPDHAAVREKWKAINLRLWAETWLASNMQGQGVVK